jgi:hypothetical protein
MAGGLVVARGLGGDEAKDVLAATRRFFDRSLSDTSRPS